MGAPEVTVRCANCGTELRAVLAPSPPTQWFPCPHCRAPVPVLVPRDPPPLYSWEVLPGLYPPLGRPRAPRWSIGSAIAVALAVVAVASIVLGGALAFYAAEATAPGQYAVSGTVYYVSGGVPHAAAGATVILTEDGGRTETNLTSGDGSFQFSGVPSGGISLNVSLSGFAPETLTTFASPVYDAGTTGLTIRLLPAYQSNGTSVALAPFPSLENFLASIGGAAILSAMIAAVAGVAAIATRRGTIRTAGVIGGGAGAGVPAVLYLLSLNVAFPLLLLFASVVGAFGAFALASGAGDLLFTRTDA